MKQSPDRGMTPAPPRLSSPGPWRDTLMIAQRGGHVDFHMHSTLSDGQLSVRDLIDYCVERGLSAMSINDHDNLDAREEGREHAAEAGIEYIPGVEISSSWDGHAAHVLCCLYESTHLRLTQAIVYTWGRR